jgi:hypothetical protein
MWSCVGISSKESSTNKVSAPPTLSVSPHPEIIKAENNIAKS